MSTLPPDRNELKRDGVDNGHSQQLTVAIVGAQKAATTAALAWLGGHPAVCSQRFRDIGFFTELDEYQRGFGWARRMYFPDASAGQMLVGKHANLWAHPTAIRRLTEHNPEILAVVILRDPVERAFSAFRFARAEGWEDAPSLLAALQGGGSASTSDAERDIRDYLGNGRYSDLLRSLYSAVPSSNVYVVFESDMTSNPAHAFAPLLARLGIEPMSSNLEVINKTGAQRSRAVGKLLRAKWVKSLSKRLIPAGARRSLRYKLLSWNASGAAQVLASPEERAWLAAYYASPDRELRALLEKDTLPWDHRHHEDPPTTGDR